MVIVRPAGASKVTHAPQAVCHEPEHAVVPGSRPVSSHTPRLVNGWSNSATKCKVYVVSVPQKLPLSTDPVTSLLPLVCTDDAMIPFALPLTLNRRSAAPAEG